MKTMVSMLTHDVFVSLSIPPPHRTETGTGLKIVLLFLQSLKPLEDLSFEGSRKKEVGDGRRGGVS